MVAQLSAVSDVFSYIFEYLGINNVWDGIRTVLDIAIVAWIFYKAFYYLKDSRAMQLVKGVIIVLFFALVASLSGLTVVSYIINIVIEVLPFLLIVIFQPDIRRVLEGLGNTTTIKAIFNRENNDDKEITEMIDEVADAAAAMGEERVGALIIFEKETSLEEICETGSFVDAKVTAQLLRLLFIPNTPLHDGAVIIKNNRVNAAACILPLSEDRQINKDLGTRHRAGIGISERTDCISVIVSEETGYISVAKNGELQRNISKSALKKILSDELIKKKKNHIHTPSDLLHKKQKGESKK